MAETEGIDRELFDAVEKNDIPKAISLIDQGASLNATQWVGVGVMRYMGCPKC